MVMKKHHLFRSIAQVFDRPEKALLQTGITIEYHQHGNVHAREKILFVMGLWTTKEAWLPTIETLLAKAPDRFHMVTFDNRGVGGSDAPEGRYTTSMMARDAIALLSYLHWSSEPVHVVGISLGGMIALEIAAQVPDQIDSLCLLVTTSGYTSYWLSAWQQWDGIANLVWSLSSRHTTSSPESLTRHVLDVLYPPEFLNQEVGGDSSNTRRRTNRHVLFEWHLERLRQIPKPPTSHGVMGQLFAIMSHRVGNDRLRQLREHGFPILVVAAEQDRLLHPSNSKRLYLDLKGESTRVSRYKDGGHGIIMQHSDSVAQDLIDTFNRKQHVRRTLPAKL